MFNLVFVTPILLCRRVNILPLDHGPCKRCQIIFPYVLLEGPPFRQGMMKNNLEHAHVVENIRFARAQKNETVIH